MEKLIVFQKGWTQLASPSKRLPG